MLVLKYLLLTTLLTVDKAQSARILGLFLTHSSSHFIVFRPLLERLAERGHQIDVLSHFPRKTPLPGYTDYSVKGSIPLISDIKTESLTLWQMLNVMERNCGQHVCDSVMNTTVADKLMKSKFKYDIIITEIFVSDCLLGYAHIFEAPIIAIVSSSNLPWTSDLMGLPDNPSYIPNYFTSYTENMNFLERFYNAASLYFTKFWYTQYIMEKSNEFIENKFGKSGVHVRDILKNISLLMVNSHFSMHQSRPMTSNVIEIGGMHITSTPKLPTENEEYLRTDLKGVVFVSFGTLFKSETFPDDKLIPMFEALGKIPYKILWKGERSNIATHIKIPNNIYFVSWIPQPAVLCHPKLKLFITHCGLASIQETIYCGKPILAVPVWADQPSNANMATSKGLGITVPFFEMTKQKMSNALEELLANSIYEENAKRMSEQFRDRPMSPMDTAVYWTEYVIRHKGAPHLKPHGANLPWYQYHCLDVLFTFVFIVFALFLVVHKLYVKLVVFLHTYKVSYSYKKNDKIK